MAISCAVSCAACSVHDRHRCLHHENALTSCNKLASTSLQLAPGPLTSNARDGRQESDHLHQFLFLFLSMLLHVPRPRFPRALVPRNGWIRRQTVVT